MHPWMNSFTCTHLLEHLWQHVLDVVGVDLVDQAVQALLQSLPCELLILW